VSGNSFKDLVPFAREPYRQELERLPVNFERSLIVRHETSMSLFSFCRESDYERGTLTDFMREEKQRKQMEAIADDLFNNAKVPAYAKFILPELVMSFA
jgi:nijmegen breakage syndrome protein 1